MNSDVELIEKITSLARIFPDVDVFVKEDLLPAISQCAKGLNYANVINLLEPKPETRHRDKFCLCVGLLLSVQEFPGANEYCSKHIIPFGA